MKCETCGNEMVQLFTSSACDWCDGKTEAKPGSLHVGYVVWRGFLGPGFPHYVFEDKLSADRWKGRQQGCTGEIRRIFSTDPFHWRAGRAMHGDVKFADHLYEVYPDAKFPKAPHRAWLAPERS